MGCAGYLVGYCGEDLYEVYDMDTFSTRYSYKFTVSESTGDTWILDKDDEVISYYKWYNGVYYEWIERP